MEPLGVESFTHKTYEIFSWGGKVKHSKSKPMHMHTYLLMSTMPATTRIPEFTRIPEKRATTIFSGVWVGICITLARVEVSRSSAACYPGQEPLTLDRRGVSLLSGLLPWAAKYFCVNSGHSTNRQSGLLFMNPFSLTVIHLARA